MPCVKGHMFRARVRGVIPPASPRPSTRTTCPRRVYRNLIRQVHRHLPLLHRYFRLRADALGLDRLEYSDLHCPLTSVAAPSVTRSPRREKLVNAAPWSPWAQTLRGSALNEAFDSRWIDWHPSTGQALRSVCHGLGLPRASLRPGQLPRKLRGSDSPWPTRWDTRCTRTSAT